jgi:hypothetical protein
LSLDIDVEGVSHVVPHGAVAADRRSGRILGSQLGAGRVDGVDERLPANPILELLADVRVRRRRKVLPG